MFENNCNTFYLAEPLNILIDPGLKNYVDLLFDNMKKDGLNPDDIKYVVNTHGHPDHYEGSVHFNNREDVKIAMYKDEISFIEQFGPEFANMLGMDFPEIEYNIPLNEGIWNVNNTELEIIHTPGHSPGSVCIYWKDKKAMFCGDLVFEMSFGRVDFPGGNPRQLIESIKKISEYNIEYLLPGHTNIITGKVNIEKNFNIIAQYFSMI